MRVPHMICLYYFTMVGSGSPEQCRKHSAARIVDGVMVPHDLFPFVVSIQMYVQRKRSWAPTCGGSIISPRVVLTACHCVTSDQKIHGELKYLVEPRNLRVVAGTAYAWGGRQGAKQVAVARRLVPHRGCQNFYKLGLTYYNDVALMFLKTALRYNRHVRPMALPSTNIRKALQIQEKLIARGARCVAVGWGRTAEYVRRQSRTLLGTTVQLMKPESCHNLLCSLFKEECRTDFRKLGQMCAASPNSSICYGDSGGPLICKGYVIGTVSYGDGCQYNLPSIFQGIRPILELLIQNGIQIGGRRYYNRTRRPRPSNTRAKLWRLYRRYN